MEDVRVLRVVKVLLSELMDGPAPNESWMLNPGDAGLLASLDKLSAEQASVVPQGGGGSIAAHVDHLSYGLHWLNRWSNGEENPFADAADRASWTRTEVSPAEWTARRDELRRQLQEWRDAIQRPRTLSDFELTGVVSSVSHLAYHVGAIRQIDRTTRGPSAND